MAVVVDNEKQDTMPTSPVGKDGKYYDVQVDCTSSKTSGLWDYNAWRLNLDYIESNSKCNLTFTSSMIKDQYDEYIKSGVALRRNTYRGKDITDYYTGNKKVNNRDLFQQISNCTFDDIYVGDYIKTNKDGNDITWLIADLNNYMYSGYYNSKLNVDYYISKSKCHATIIPSYTLEYGAKMNDTNTSGVADPDLHLTDLENREVSNVGGYMGSNMKQVTLPNILQTYVEPVFGNHIIEHSNWLSDAVVDGKASHSSSYKTKIDLMSEISVFGTTIVSSTIYDIGIDNRQYAIFQLKPELILSDGTFKGFSQWLRTVSSSNGFFALGNQGNLVDAYATTTWAGVRPYFLID